MAISASDLEAVIEGLREVKRLTGKDGVLAPRTTQRTESALQTERDNHLAEEDAPNLKSDSTPKKVKSSANNFEFQALRDRAGTFAPQLVKKHQAHLTDELGWTVLAVYALGTSYQDIRGTHSGRVLYRAVARLAQRLRRQVIPEIAGMTRVGSGIRVRHRQAGSHRKHLPEEK